MTLHNIVSLHFNLQQKHWSSHNSFVGLMSNNPYIQVIFTTWGLLQITRKLSTGWRGRLLSPSGRPTLKNDWHSVFHEIHIFVNLLLNPSGGANSLEVLEEELARLILLTLKYLFFGVNKNSTIFYLQLLAAVEVNIVLPAVPCLVHVGESRVEGDRLLQRVLNNLGHHGRMQ